ncbi:N-acetylmuramoyl-L-alanine amidase [Celeribacter sp.]|uniref:N-acetylmuramoyl-L-alanine amidase n=1 Tax=Celeribacter sp. TaxID=1890673 RepID=UPI003A910133
MTYLPLSQVRYLVIHYSATPIEHSYGLDDIDAMHRKRGFKKIGYHAYAPRAGGWQPGRDVVAGNRTFEMGAHSQGENDESLGFCYEGGVHLLDLDAGFDSRTPEQIEAMIGWIDTMLLLTGGDGIDPAKGPVVIGHRDMPGAATQCPGFDAGAWWREVVKSRQLTAQLKVAADGSRGLPSWLRWLLKFLSGGHKA